MSAVIGVQHTEVENQAGHTFWRLLLCWFECCYRGPTHRGGKSWCKLVTEFGGYSDDGLNAAIGVQHTEEANIHKADCLSKCD